MSREIRQAFMSYNKGDRSVALAFAHALIEQGVGIWFDEWEVPLGNSIVSGVEKGLSEADTFLLLWSANAHRSKWVGTELNAFLLRRIQDNELRVIPLLLDDTPLPALVADFKGLPVPESSDLVAVAANIVGALSTRELVRRLQNRLFDLAPFGTSTDPLPYRVCPICGSAQLHCFTFDDPKRDDQYLCLTCEECGWRDSTEL